MVKPELVQHRCGRRASAALRANWSRLAAAALLLLLLLLSPGCATNSPSPLPAAGNSGTEDVRPAATVARAGKGRAQLWAENCMRCHNARPSTYYSEGEWVIAMHHMRVRGYLTASETEAITEFFRATK